MKVLFVINSSNNGGAIKMIVTLYQQMKERYPQSQIVFLKRIESQYSNIEGAYYLSDKMSSFLDYVRVYRELYKVIGKEKPDAIISFLPLANIYASTIGRMLDVKIRIASQRNPPQIYGSVVRFLDRFIGSRGFYSANVCNSQAGQDAFANYPLAYKKLLSVINNCVEPIDTSLSRMRCRDVFAIANDDVILTCVGRLHDQKNHELLIDSLQYIKNASLYLAGDGPLREQLEAQVIRLNLKDRVIFLGDLDRDEVKKLLCASDIFVIPSRYEGLSNSLIEAMSYGLPIVFSNIPSFTSFLKENDGEYAGLIFEQNDSNLLAAKVNMLVEDVDLRLRYKIKSLEKVKDLTAEQMTSKFINLMYAEK